MNRALFPAIMLALCGCADLGQDPDFVGLGSVLTPLPAVDPDKPCAEITTQNGEEVLAPRGDLNLATLASEGQSPAFIPSVYDFGMLVVSRAEFDASVESITITFLVLRENGVSFRRSIAGTVPALDSTVLHFKLLRGEDEIEQLRQAFLDEGLSPSRVHELGVRIRAKLKSPTGGSPAMIPLEYPMAICLDCPELAVTPSCTTSGL